MDMGLPMLAAFIDIRKAFDCVQQPILLNKLSAIGLHQDTLEWFASYLSNRRQKVLANNTLSLFLEVSQGVPQDSVRSPLFYIIYANDIERFIKNCKISLYADDTVLYLARKDFNVTVRLRQDDLDALSIWCLENGIQMNVEKTKLMLFGSKSKTSKLPPFEVKVQHEPLDLVVNYKYLGLTLDDKLNYNKHVPNTISKVTPKLKQLRRMRYFLDTKAANLVYKNMILPILEYGDIFMLGASAENRRRL